MRRRFEFQEGTASKFWEVEVDGNRLTTWWGKIGTAGQSKAKDFDSTGKAQHEYDKLVAEKTGKGYQEISAGNTASPAVPTAPAPTKAAPQLAVAGVQPRAQKPQVVHDDDDDDDDDEENDENEDDDEGASSASGKRRFEFEEDSSSKFWEIAMDGTNVTTWWGRLGTSGQSKSLSFATEGEARKQYDKLIAEKTKKGYEEVESGGGGGGAGGFTIPEEWAPYARPAWTPQTKSGDGTLTASKFSGIPWLAAGESWPVCQGCSLPMQLFLQLNLATLPDEVKTKFGSGLLQLFYCCDECEIDHEAFFGNETTMLVRLIEPKGECGSPKQSAVQDPFPAELITGWAKLPVEYPSSDDLSEKGVDVEDFVDQEMDQEVYPNSDDKLYGWPSWVQGPEYGICKKCSQPMELIFQVSSEDHVPHMFGDCGIAHITQCTTHKDQFKFGWACS